MARPIVGHALAACSAATLLAACATRWPPAPPPPGSGAPFGAWRSLLDDASLTAWRGFKAGAVPPGWRMADGVLSKDGPVADLVSRDQFGDFELELDWRIGEAGNSGI